MPELTLARVVEKQSDPTALEMGMTPYELVVHIGDQFKSKEGKRVRHVDARGEYISEPFTFHYVGFLNNVAGYFGETPEGVMVFVAHEPGGSLLPSSKK